MKKRKNIVEKFLDQLIFVINSIIKNLFTMKPMELFKYLIEIIVIILILVVLKLPFEFIKDVGNTALNYVIPVDKSITVIFEIMIDALYALTAITSFVIMYRKRFYNRYRVDVKTKNEYDEIYGDLYKGLIVLVSIPLFIVIIFLAIILLFGISIIMQGVKYYGPLLVVISLLLAFIMTAHLVVSYLKDKKVKNKYVKMSGAIVSIVFLIGGLVTVVEFMNTKYYRNSVPNMDYSIRNESLEKYIDDKIDIICENCYENYEVIYDEKLHNKIIVEVSYYDEFLNTKFVSDKNKIAISGSPKAFFNKAMKEDLIKNLKNNQIYNYSLVFEKNLIIYINKNDESKINVIIK